MLILPPGQAEPIVAGHRLSVREKRLIGAVTFALAALAVVLVIALVSGGRASANGCVNATIAGPVGAEEISQCGATARATCATARAPGAFTPQSAATVAAECRKAGLPVGP